VCLWIASLLDFRGMVLEEIVQACAGVRGTAWQSHADLCRPEGLGPAEIMWI
jgi:hypothetical protein